MNPVFGLSCVLNPDVRGKVGKYWYTWYWSQLISWTVNTVPLQMIWLAVLTILEVSAVAALLRKAPKLYDTFNHGLVFFTWTTACRQNCCAVSSPVPWLTCNTRQEEPKAITNKGEDDSNNPQGGSNDPGGLVENSSNHGYDDDESKACNGSNLCGAGRQKQQELSVA